MRGENEVAPEVVEQVRAICLGLPEVHEERAWIGTRWRVRSRTFAHVLRVIDGQPEAFAAAAGTGGSATVVTFRSEGPELEVLRRAGPPYFYAGWGRDAVGLVLGADTDWDEVAELLTESYCVLAPRKLVARVERPEDGAAGGDGPDGDRRPGS